MSRLVEVISGFHPPGKHGRCRPGSKVKLTEADAEAAVALGFARYLDDAAADVPSREDCDDLNLPEMQYHGDDGVLALARDVAEFVEVELPGRTRDVLEAFLRSHKEATRLILKG